MYQFGELRFRCLCAVLCLVAQLCPTLCNSMDCSLPSSSVHRDSPGKNTGVGCHAFLQRIFPTQGLNPGLLHWGQILYHLSHQRSCPGYPSSIPVQETKTLLQDHQLPSIQDQNKHAGCLLPEISPFLMLLLFSHSLCLTLCDPMDCDTPGFPVLHYLPEFIQIQAH